MIKRLIVLFLITAASASASTKITHERTVNRHSWEIIGGNSLHFYNDTAYWNSWKDINLKLDLDFAETHKTGRVPVKNFSLSMSGKKPLYYFGWEATANKVIGSYSLSLDYEMDLEMTNVSFFSDRSVEIFSLSKTQADALRLAKSVVIQIRKNDNGKVSIFIKMDELDEDIQLFDWYSIPGGKKFTKY